MKAFRGGWTISLGLLLAATAANAQEAPPQGASRTGYVAVSDFSGPNVDVPPGPPAPAYGRPLYGPGPAGAGYAPGPAEYGPPLMPPRGVYAVLRENGFSPLGAPRLRGLFYSISAIDRRGEDGRLVIDGRDGRIVRFVPAEHFGGYGGYGDGYYGGAPRPSYGPLEPMTRLDGTRLEGPPPRPPGAVPPKVASRMPSTIPVPRAAPRRPADEKPLAEKPVPAPAPMQQSAAVQPRPAVSPPAASPSAASPTEAKAALVIQPTQPMPKVQDLE
ncbi:hypothetical protein [Bradyrhizobium sp.]|uniref:hypothetical protein n=1 Tax=Bradyrhizobium sp. TaxID=376 RepID=UPI003C365C21